MPLIIANIPEACRILEVMLFGISLEELIAAVGVFGVAAIIFAESGLLVGFFLPGDTLLFTVGLLLHEGVIKTPIELVVLLLTLAAILGDNVGYAFGRRVGPRLFRRKDSLLFHHENLERAEKFYEKYGPATIVIARFVPVVRTFAPIVAGVGKMNYRRFLTFNILGGVLWVVGITYVGYYAGAFLEARGIEIDHLILPIIGLAMFITIISPLTHIMRDPSSRTIFINKIKRLFKHRKATKSEKAEH